MKFTKKEKLLLTFLLIMVIVSNYCLADSKRIKLEKLSKSDLVTFCSESGPRNELIYKISDNNPILLNIQESDYTANEVLKNEPYSREYTISSKGDIAFVSEDKICIYLTKEKRNW